MHFIAIEEQIIMADTADQNNLSAKWDAIQMFSYVDFRFYF